MNKSRSLTEAEIKEFAADWYHKLDIHVPLKEYISLLAEEGLEMRFPEATVKGFEGFKSWYERVICLFFDELHIVKDVKLTSVSNDETEVKVVVRWEASRWNPPAPNSERIILDAYQTWIMKRSPVTQKPMIVTYIVDSLDYAEGSVRL